MTTKKNKNRYGKKNVGGIKQIQKSFYRKIITGCVPAGKITILTLLLMFTFTIANSQTSSITVQNVQGLYAPDTILVGEQIIFEMRYTNISGDYVVGFTNGFKVYSPDGASWTPLTGAGTGAVTFEMFDGGFFINTFSLTGTGADTIGIGGFALLKAGIPDGFDEHVVSIETGVSAADDGKTLCIDSAFFPPANSWLWSGGTTGTVIPAWDGPYCYTIYELQDAPPEITNCISGFNADHCAIASFDFDAIDPENESFTFELVLGPGSINANTGEWSYSPSIADVGTISISVRACDLSSCGTICVVEIAITNSAPTITCPGVTSAFVGSTAKVQIIADAVDCDQVTFSISSITPTPVGTMSIDPNTGLLSFAPAQEDLGVAGQSFLVDVCVTDGDLSACCQVQFVMIAVVPFRVCIEQTRNTIQGGHEIVDITFESGSEALGGFDLLVAYDASALSFVGALEGSIFADCGWEYFNFRFGASSNCGSACPSGLLRIVGIAETNNGAFHPTCYLMSPGDTFASLDFLVTDDRTLECQRVAIRFFWLDCGDNTLSSYTGDSLFISSSVFDFDKIVDITNPTSGYPTYNGSQDEDCFPQDGNPQKVPIRFIEFCNGGIDIVCADSIDSRGDINLNEISNEIADAVLYSNYFVHGLSVFTINLDGQVAASDVNADGLTLTVSDLVYLIRIITGNSDPIPKLSPILAEWANENGTVSIDAEMGAALIIVEGEVVPILLADKMEMKHNFDGANTRVLVYSLEAGASFSGDFLLINGNVLSTEFAGYDGNIVVAKELPNSFALRQNYPNPFNPTTTITFESKGGAYALSIYNVTGRKVAEYNGTGSGTIEIEVDGAGWSTGIYFYTLEIGNFFKETKKMVLLK